MQVKNGKNRRVLVTGGAGFIGSHLVDALVQGGCDVKVLDNLTTGHLENLAGVKGRIAFSKGDIRNKALLMSLAEGCDVIYHQAAIVSVPQTVEDPVGSTDINELGTLNVLESARNRNVKRVVIASSCAVYGNDPQLPKQELMVPSPESPYAVQKLHGEQHARLYSKIYGVETVCLRYFNVYGPRQDPRSPYSGVISIFLSKAAAGEPPVIYGDGEQSRDFVYVKDVVKANLLAGETESAGGACVNVGTGCSVTINALWEMISSISNCRAVPQHTAVRVGDVVASRAGTDHAASILGFKPDYPFDKGLETTFRWYVETKKNT